TNRVPQDVDRSHRKPLLAAHRPLDRVEKVVSGVTAAGAAAENVVQRSSATGDGFLRWPALWRKINATTATARQIAAEDVAQDFAHLIRWNLLRDHLPLAATQYVAENV